MLLQLIASSGSQTFDLPSGTTLVVGRALNSDLPIFDPTVSRRHAELTSDGTGVELRDLDSRNGTFLNGARVQRARASTGDTIAFGSVKFRVRESERPAAETPRSARAQRAVSSTVFRPVPPREAPGLLGASLTSTASGHLAVPARPARPEGLEGGAGDQREAYAELLATQQKLTLLLEVSTALSRAIETDALLEKIVEFTFQIFDADLVAVLLTDDRGELVPKRARDRAGSAAARAVPQSIARTAVEQKVGVLSDDAPQDQRFGSESVLLQKVRSTMCAPLVGGDGAVLGVLYVDNLTATHRFRESDLEFLIAFAGIAAVAIENSRFAERIRREALVRSNFERYFAPALAERIAASPGAAAPGGEKRDVAVLFSDIRGFTALSEAMRPDETASLLSEYLSEMVEVVFRHGGTLDKFIGDAVMAQWGAPIRGEADADQAMAAALDMLRTLEVLNARWRAAGRPAMQVGIGLCYGEAFAGNIGSERRLEFTVIGDTVNTASRLCAAAGGGEILLSDSMRRALRDAPPLDECAPLELKGKSQPVRVFRVATAADGAPCEAAAGESDAGPPA
ncbi:MAG: adenylate/guanylate cyclase domain-containing protein [Gemmatimonadaceae bacterium]